MLRHHSEKVAGTLNVRSLFWLDCNISVVPEPRFQAFDILLRHARSLFKLRVLEHEIVLYLEFRDDLVQDFVPVLAGLCSERAVVTVRRRVFGETLVEGVELCLESDDFVLQH